MRYFIFLSYDGSRYHGWQIQPNATSVQEKINQSLSTLLRTEVLTIGAGRTDAGVHAHMMVAHFDISYAIDCAWLKVKLNRILPPDISVNSVRQVIADAHARFSALTRTYHYYIYRYKSPFLRHYAAQISYPLNFDLMNEAAIVLTKEHDFTSFSKLHTNTKTNICHVSQAKWYQVNDNFWRFEITADRFLRNMVRSIVGTLIEVGRGKISLEEFKKIIALKNRCAAGDSMPGNALSLVNIVYDEHIYI